MARFDELANNGNIRRRAAGIAFLERGSNSARTTPPPGGGGGVIMHISQTLVSIRV